MAERDGHVVDEKRLPGRQGPIALVYLGIERARAIPIDELADAVWGEELPRAWETALSAIVSKVRAALVDVGLDARHSITTVSGRYQLALPADAWVDVEAARVALDEAEGRVRARRYRDAWGPGNVAASIANRGLLAGVDMRVGGACASVVALGACPRAVVSGLRRAGEHGVAARRTVRTDPSGARAFSRNGMAAAHAVARGRGQPRGSVARVHGVPRSARQGAGHRAVARDRGSAENFSHEVAPAHARWCKKCLVHRCARSVRTMARLSARRWLVISCIAVVGIALAVAALPEVVRRVAIVRIHALTGRPVAIDRVDLNLITGRLTVRGFRLAERDGSDRFADFGELDVRLHLPSLLLGRLWIRDMILSDSTVRVVRLPTNEFNFADLIGRSTTNDEAPDLTVDHFVLRRGTVVLEDRALPQARTWTSEQITIEAHNVSTRRGDGTAVGSSVMAGTPMSVAIKDLRLHPIHVHATMAVQGLDLTLAQVYLPPDSMIVERGRATAALTVTIDARDGIRADGTGKFEDVALLRADGREVVALMPGLTARVNGFAFKEGDARLGHLALDGAVSVRDPMPRQRARFQHASVRANIANLTWPAATPGQVEVLASVQGGGNLALTGTVQVPPAASQLRLRVDQLRRGPVGAVPAHRRPRRRHRGGRPSRGRGARSRRSRTHPGIDGDQSPHGGRREPRGRRRPARRGERARNALAHARRRRPVCS